MITGGITALRQAGAIASKFEALPIVSKILKWDPVQGQKMIDLQADEVLKHLKQHSQPKATANSLVNAEDKLTVGHHINTAGSDYKGDVVADAANLIKKNKGTTQQLITRNKNLLTEEAIANKNINQKEVQARSWKKPIHPLRDDVREMLMRNFSSPVEGTAVPEEFLLWKGEKNPQRYLLEGSFLDKIKNDKLLPANVKKNFLEVNNINETIRSTKWRNSKVLEDLNKNPVYKKLKNEKDHESMTKVLNAWRQSHMKMNPNEVASKTKFSGVAQESVKVGKFIRDTGVKIPKFKEIEKVRASLRKGRYQGEGRDISRTLGAIYSKKKKGVLELELKRIKDVLGKDKWKTYLERVEKRKPGLFLSGVQKKYPTAFEKYDVRKQVGQKYMPAVKYLKHEIAKILGFDPITMSPQALDDMGDMVSNMGAHAAHHRLGAKGGANPATWDINLGIINVYAEKSKILQRMTKAVESGDPAAYYAQKLKHDPKRFRWTFDKDKASLMKMRHKLEVGDQKFGRNLNWQALERWMKRVGLQKAVDEDNPEMIKYFTELEPLETKFGTFDRGGLINGHLTDTIPPERGPMPQGLPLLDPLESIERSQRQHFPIGGAVGAGKLWGALSKVPRAVARFGDIKKPKLTKPTTTTELSVAQAVEEKPAMFLESVKVIEDAPDSANLTADEWLGYVKNKNVSETELDEFGLGPMLKNLAGKDTTVDAADLKAAQEAVKKTKESGIGINKQFSDIMKKHKGDFSNPEVIAIKEKLDIYKAALKGDMDILSRLEGAGKVRIPKAKLIEMYDMEMPKIDMDIAIAEPVSRGASDIVGMLLKVRERGRGGRWDEATEADIFSNDARLLSQLHQPPQDRVGFVLRNKLIDVMKGTTKVVPRADDDPLVHHLLKPDGKQHYHFERGTHFKEMWETAFPNLFHTTNQIVKQGHFEDLKHLVKAEDVAELAKAKGIPEEDAFKQLYQALNIFDRSIMTADVPIPFWTKKLLYRLGDMDQGRGFFYKSKRSPAHEGTQFIPGGSGYGELKFYQNFTPGSVRAAEGQYKSGHFSGEVFQGNTGNSPFMWTRFSERIDESGRKLLLGEEIQSDLHQNVAQKGYAYAPRLDKHDVLAEMGEFAKQLDTKAQTLESTRLRKETIKQLPRHERESPANVAELKNIEKAIKKLIKDVKTLKAKVAAQAKRTGTSGQVHPDTAFKKSENYAKLAMQGLMKMASDKGYDGVALSTGRMKKTYGNIPKGGDKFYDEIGVKAMERMAKKSGYKLSYTTIVDGNGYSWEKVPVILMRDVNTGKKFAGDATIPVYKKGGIVNKKMVKK